VFEIRQHGTHKLSAWYYKCVIHGELLLRGVKGGGWGVEGGGCGLDVLQKESEYGKDEEVLIMACREKGSESWRV